MKNLATIALLIICLRGSVAAQMPANEEPDTLGTILQRITSGSGSVTVSSYGNSESFMIDGVNHLHRFIHYISINNGPVAGIYTPAWRVISPITITDGTGTSSIMTGNILQIDFTNKIVDNTGGLVDWLVRVTFKNLTADDLSVCYYPYLDYDLFDASTGDIGFYSAMDDDLGVPTIRVQKVERDGVFVLADTNNLSRDWRIGAHPEVRDLLDNAKFCTVLGSMDSPFGPGDFEGALQFPFTIAANGSVTVNLRLGRFQ